MSFYKKVAVLIIVLSCLVTTSCNRANDTLNIPLSEKQVQKIDTNEIYKHLLSKIKPDDNELYISNWDGLCNIDTNGTINHLSNHVFAVKGDFVHCYLIYIGPENQIKISELSKEKYGESIFSTTVSMLKVQEILEGINKLPWDSIFNEYKVDSPIDYQMGVGKQANFNLPATSSARYFMWSNNAYKEIDSLPQQAEYYYNIAFSPYYGTHESASPNNHLLFFYSAN